jgi:hypothetical protein
MPLVASGPAERALSEPSRGSPPIEARIYLTRSGIGNLVTLGWITGNRPLAAAVAALAETALTMVCGRRGEGLPKP